jgi:hypothetical protein
VLGWLRRRASRRGVSAALGVLDEVFHPGAETAREVRDAQPDQVQPAPSPGDRLLDEGRVVIERPEG